MAMLLTPHAVMRYICHMCFPGNLTQVLHDRNGQMFV